MSKRCRCEVSPIVKEVDRVEIGILSSSDVRRLSVALIDSQSLDGTGSVYDPRMGPLNEQDICISCGQLEKACPGHMGHIELAAIVVHPRFVRMVIIVLKLFCVTCHRLLLPTNHIIIESLPKQNSRRLTALIARMKRITVCGHCNEAQPKFVFTGGQINIKRQGLETKAFHASEIYNILNDLRDDDLVAAGFIPSRNHPSAMLMSAMPVPPHRIRPMLRVDEHTGDDDLTTMLVDVIKANNALKRLITSGAASTLGQSKQKAVPTTTPTARWPVRTWPTFPSATAAVPETRAREQAPEADVISPQEYHAEYTRLYTILINRIFAYYDNSDDKARSTTTNRKLVSLHDRYGMRKEGRMRANLMGKRVNMSARTVIGPDPTLHLDELAVPEYIASALTYPERVNAINRDTLTDIIRNGKAKFVVREDGSRINLAYALVTPATVLRRGDVVMRKNNAGETVQLRVARCVGDKCFRVVSIKRAKDTNGLRDGDVVMRVTNGKSEEIRVQMPTKKQFDLRIGDVVERELQNGDYVIFNRQPTLHTGSFLAMRIVIESGLTFRLNLAVTAGFNADFDGDEASIHVPQSEEACAEIKNARSSRNILSSQNGHSDVSIVQDGVLGVYLMTATGMHLAWADVMQIFARSDHAVMLAERYVDIVCGRICVCGITNAVCPCKSAVCNEAMRRGDVAVPVKHVLSSILPRTFAYRNSSVTIVNGVIVDGVFDKSVVGSAGNGIIACLYRQYGHSVVADFVDDVQYLSNALLSRTGFSIGIGDCITPSKLAPVNLSEAQDVEDATSDPRVRELRVTATLDRIRDQQMLAAKSITSSSNALATMVASGSKGNTMNIGQIFAIVGQQTIENERIPMQLDHGRRTLPHYPRDPVKRSRMSAKAHFEEQGFVSSSFMAGLTPEETFIHAMSGRHSVVEGTHSVSKAGTTHVVFTLLFRISVQMRIQISGKSDRSVQRDGYRFRRKYRAIRIRCRRT